MKKLLSFIAVFLSINLHATVDEYVSDIYYGNGIMTSKYEAKIALDKTVKPAVLHDIYQGDTAKMNRYHHFDVAYNYSFKEATIPGSNVQLGGAGIVLDILESYEQLKNTSLGWEVLDYTLKAVQIYFLEKKPWGEVAKETFKNYLVDHAIPKEVATYITVQLEIDDLKRVLELSKYFKDKYLANVHDRDLEEMVKKYKTSIKSGHGVIIVSHSQGNLFAVEAAEKIAKDGSTSWMKPYIYHVSVASPATKFASDNHWFISLDNDLVANIGTVGGEKIRNYARYYTYSKTYVIPDMSYFEQFEEKFSEYISEGYWLDGYEPSLVTFNETYDGKTFYARGEPIESSYTQINFHAFDFYMGKTVYPLYIDTNVTIIPKKAKKTDTHQSKARKAIVDGIRDAIVKHDEADSQWDTTNPTGCVCKDKRIEVFLVPPLRRWNA